MEKLQSKDGATIAYEHIGTGPALILITTTAEDHHSLSGLATQLARNFTVYNYDRRGRGESGNPQLYDPAREIEDLDTLIDIAGGKASLASGSGGCVLALDAATTLGPKAEYLYLYEPPFIIDDSRPPVPANYVEHVTQLVKEGKRSEAIEYFMVQAVGVPTEYIAPMKADPSWEIMSGYAHTLAYDGRIVKGTQDGKPLPRDRWHIQVPTAVVVGENSPSFFHSGAQALVDLLPAGSYQVLNGQDHSAFWMAPEVITQAIINFIKK